MKANKVASSKLIHADTQRTGDELADTKIKTGSRISDTQRASSKATISDRIDIQQPGDSKLIDKTTSSLLHLQQTHRLPCSKPTDNTLQAARL